ncbi:hypothetical protein LUZ63_012390 [Rhynchospora breviuscula]|uniref:Disease resistance protein RGA3 n=1 Tax=Rhynchospora breviuscula TaxID=2022672 RepID=A0A9Q0CL68_9POAL|nr:hypothetical protein LUZ63_012390 [Rhynchospora breviuscula]
MASDLLSGVISTLVEKATDSVLEEFGSMLGLGVEQDRQKLHWKLLTVQAVIANAEKYCAAEPAIKEWLHAVKTAAYEAEDVLDELKYEALQKAVEAEVRAKRAKFSQPFHLSLCWFNFSKNEMGKKLKDVLEKIDVIVADISQFRFLETSGANSIVPRLQSHSHVNESTVIGRSEDLERIVSILILEQFRRENVEVLPIVGMGGLGKTTLAQLIYGDERVKNHFQLHLWVCVSDEFDVARIAKSIIDLAIGSDSKLPMENMELIQRRLRDELLMKKFLLILDDVWNENRTKWEQLKLLLSCGAPGSMVIVTTRSKKAASVMGTRSAYVLQGLNEDHMWDIFRQRAFGMEVDEEPQFVEIGKQLIKKCWGLPLVAKSVGGLMSNKKETWEWFVVLESDIWKEVVVESEIIPVLKLSYMNLPSYMKRCFAFCAIFPKDYEIQRDTLIQLWMSNGLIPTEERVREIEEKGLEIFNELAWKGFFQDVKTACIKEYYFLNNLHTVCRMHDIMHDLAKSVAGSECATMLNLDGQNNLSSDVLHLYACCMTQDIASLLQQFSFTRTILSTAIDSEKGEDSAVLDLSFSSSFRALSLRDATICEIQMRPRNLKHLRYLDLSWCPILILPESLSTLYNLQTLNLSNCKLLRLLPQDMRYMQSLRHVNLDGCDALVSMPSGLGRLSSLQTLTMYIVDPDKGCGIEELKNLNLGGRLELHLGKVRNASGATQANMYSKKNLKKLLLAWSANGVPFVEEVFEPNPDNAKAILQALEPHRGLDDLEIMHYGVAGAKDLTWKSLPGA